MIIETSWDDGSKLDLKIAKLLYKYKLTGTFYIPTGCELTPNEIKKLSEKQRINFGCSLKSGAFIVTYNKEPVFEKSKKDDGLIFFFLKLLSSLQFLGTVPAMDNEIYIKQLKQKAKN